MIGSLLSIYLSLTPLYFIKSTLLDMCCLRLTNEQQTKFVFIKPNFVLLLVSFKFYHLSELT